MLQGSLLPVSSLTPRPFLAPERKINPVHWMAFWPWAPPLQIKRVKRPTPEQRRVHAWLEEPTLQTMIRRRLLAQLARPQRKRKG